jgi:hypothetical protein
MMEVRRQESEARRKNEKIDMIIYVVILTPDFWLLTSV